MVQGQRNLRIADNRQPESVCFRKQSAGVVPLSDRAGFYSLGTLEPKVASQTCTGVGSGGTNPSNLR